MTFDDFRRLALDMPEAVEAAHMSKADFRVRNKIFATLDDAEDLGTLKLSRDQQQLLIDSLGPAVFPANGSWGAQGWTRLRLADLEVGDVVPGLRMAWCNVAPKTLIRTYDQQKGKDE